MSYIKYRISAFYENCITNKYMCLYVSVTYANVLYNMINIILCTERRNVRTSFD